MANYIQTASFKSVKFGSFFFSDAIEIGGVLAKHSLNCLQPGRIRRQRVPDTGGIALGLGQTVGEDGSLSFSFEVQTDARPGA